jgi:tripartite-type tricarboxylate transporter receptor subunit TctC
MNATASDSLRNTIRLAAPQSRRNTRRSALLWPFVAALLAQAPALALAQQAWPQRPLTLVVPTPPGGTNDIMARMFADKVSRELGQPIVVENKGGAGGNIGTTAVARAAPDGYTFLMQSQAAHTSVPLLMKNPGWTHSDFKPVAAIAVAPYVVVGTTKVPAKNLKQFVDYARVNQGKLGYASIGQGTLPHFGGLMLNKAAGLDLTHVPYKGSGPATIDLISGQVHLLVVTAAPVIEHIKSGKLAALAVASPERLPSLAEVPTTAEFGYPGLTLETWLAWLAPKGTPDAIIEKMNAAVRKAAATEDIRKRALELGAQVKDWTPAQLGAVIDRDVLETRKIIKDNNITAEN